MITELPFVSPADLAEQFRPGRPTKTKSALETLRRRGVLSEGITRPIRDAQGRTRGTLRLYSALARDAAALAATGDDVRARQAAALASHLERRQDARRLADALAATAATLSVKQQTLALLVKMAAREHSVAQQLARHAAAVEKARRGFDPVSRVALGHIASHHEALANVVLTDGSRLPVHRDKLPVPDDDIGAPIAIRWADLGRGVWMTTEAAIEVPNDGVYPFERDKDLPPVTVPASVLSAPATIRRSKRTSIID